MKFAILILRVVALALSLSGFFTLQAAPCSIHVATCHTNLAQSRQALKHRLHAQRTTEAVIIQNLKMHAHSNTERRKQIQRVAKITLGTVIITAGAWYLYKQFSQQPQQDTIIPPAAQVQNNRPEQVEERVPAEPAIPVIIDQPLDVQNNNAFLAYQDIPLLPMPYSSQSASEEEEDEEIDIGQDSIEQSDDEAFEGEPENIAQQELLQAEIVEHERRERARKALEQEHAARMRELEAMHAERQRVIREQTEILAQQEQEYQAAQAARAEAIAELEAQSTRAQKQLQKMYTQGQGLLLLQK